MILQFEYSGTQDQLYAVYYIQFSSQQKNLKTMVYDEIGLSFKSVSLHLHYHRLCQCNCHLSILLNIHCSLNLNRSKPHVVEDVRLT